VPSAQRYEVEFGDVWYRDQKPERPGLTQDPGVHICAEGEMMAVAFDEQDGVLHKHGVAAKVIAWAGAARERLAASPIPDLARYLITIEFPATQDTLSELNACIATSGRISGFQKHLALIGDASTANKFP
jgi:hypothetical protein